MKNLIYLLILSCSITTLSAQEGPFNYQIIKVEGDLNKDNITDYAVVDQDTLNDISPYRLQIYFGQANGQYKLIVSTIKAIAPQYPEGKEGYRTGNVFDDITIKKGILSINNQLLRGHFEHKFRFQNGKFELIGFSEVYSDGHGIMTTIDFNLLTGTRLEKDERYDTDKVLPFKKKKVMIRPLPKLQDFVPNDNELY